MKKCFLKIFIVITVLANFAFSQKTADGTIFYEELSKQFCTEQMRSIYDSFFINLQNNPDSKGFVVFNGKEGLEGQVLTLQKMLRLHTENRKFNPARFEILRGENKEITSVKLWVIYNDANFQKPEKFVSEKIISAARFDKGFADLMKYKSLHLKTIRYDGAAETCDIGINFEEFSKILLSDSDLTGILIIYNSKKNAKKVAELTINKLNKKHKIPKNRLKVLYKEKLEEPEMELWLVPKGKEIPNY